ncbi:hypothetical protein [Armatimonas sp.]|uniref:hypothetical protein n=1 Tax=Armatimonas sp. TaxID=1872638 RepID=UPI00286A4A51|nr:hypothetical protein [Armatimonas sp.]
MTKIDENELAGLWHEITTMDPVVSSGITDTNAKYAQPGYAGSDYVNGNDRLLNDRLLFIGMYPGGESKGNNNKLVYDALKNLRDNNTLDAFWFLNSVLEDEISSDIRPWSIWKYIKPILEGSGFGINEVSLINLCPWRCADSKIAYSSYEKCWNDFVKRQIELLNPTSIVALGTENSKGGVGHFLGEKFRNKLPIYSVKRTRNDADFAQYSDTAATINHVISKLARPPQLRQPLLPTIIFDLAQR